MNFKLVFSSTINLDIRQLTQIYRGPSTSHRVAGLEANSEYRVRVCAVRQTKEQSQLHGCFSQTAFFCTAPLKAVPKKDIEAADGHRVKIRWFNCLSGLIYYNLTHHKLPKFKDKAIFIF